MNIKKNKVLSLFLSVTLVLGIFIGAIQTEVSATEGVKELTIVHSNDVHGRLSLVDSDYDSELGHGVLKTYLDGVRKDNKNVLMLDAGDALHGTTDVNLSKGKAVIDVMNIVGYDAMTPGNHDFNYGFEQLLALEKDAKFPLLAANVEYEKTGKPAFEPYVIKEMDNGLKVGIIGLATPETKYKSHPDNTIGLNFTSPTEAAAKYVKEIRDDVDLVVVLGHLGVAGTIDETSKQVLENVDGIDLFIDGHSHEETHEVVNGAYLVQSGGHFKNIGRVDITVDGDDVKIEPGLYEFEEAKELEENKEIVKYVEELKAKNEVLLEEVAGKTEVHLNGAREDVRTKETNLGNLISDAMRESVNADVAFTNGGGIRADIEEGDITVGDIITAFPFTNTVASIEVTGAELLAALENGVSIYPEQLGGFPQVSGLTFTFDPSKEAGERVVEVMVGDKALDENAKYTLAANDFMASGGDGYTMFEGKDFIAEAGLLSDVMRAYLDKHGTVNPQVEGRIKVLEETEEKPAEEKPVEEKPVEEKPVKPEAKYTVKSGDVLWKIAAKYSKTWQQLANHNKLKNPHRIYPGQILNIPN